MRILLFWCIVALLWIVAPADGLRAQNAQASERARARDIFRELIEIPTTAADNATPKAAQAMADRLIAAGFPTEDVHVLGPNPSVGNLVARLRGRRCQLPGPSRRADGHGRSDTPPLGG